MSLAEASEVRKAHLLALKRRKAGEAVGEESIKPVLKNRNFDPESRTLKKHVQTDDPSMQDTVENTVDGMAKKIISEDEEKRAQELDVFNIAPKRPNWDLKRELEKKLARLERKTQQAIHTLIRQRLAAQHGDSEDLVGAMNAQEKQAASEPPSDEED